MAQNDLEPLAPQDALDWYLEHRRDDLRTATRRKHRSALGTFVDWTGEAGIDDMNDVGGRQLMEFKTWRKSETDLETVSLNGNLAILQRFLRFCENIDAVAEGVADRVPLPNVPPEEEVNYQVPTDERSRAFDRTTDSSNMHPGATSNSSPRSVSASAPSALSTYVTSIQRGESFTSGTDLTPPTNTVRRSRTVETASGSSISPTNSGTSSSTTSTTTALTSRTSSAGSRYSRPPAAVRRRRRFAVISTR
jgi:hypothetical protein